MAKKSDHLATNRLRPSRNDMRSYIVLLSVGNIYTSQAKGRAERYSQGLAYTSAFHDLLEKWIDEHNLRGEVATVGIPTTFPVLAVTCTARAASKIKELSNVDSVVSDDDVMQLTH